ncbi:MAG: transglycosylase SLT domain-containing protein [Flexilinea sp.]|nr:transglycosylase SLT domain-containing protein [Flexilinea sp.]
MRKNIKILGIVICLMMLLGACDSRRNQILSNILVSPTATETPAPPTATPTITPSPTPTLTPTPVILVENMDLLMFGEYDHAEHEIQNRIENAANSLDILRAQTDLIESAWAQSDYQRCLNLMNDFTDTLETMENRPKALISKTYYLHAQCAGAEGLQKEKISSLEKYIEYSPDSPILPEVIADAAYAYQELEDYEMFRNYLDISAARGETGLSEYQKLDYALSFSYEGNGDEAIRQLTDLYNNSADENIKAAADYYLGSVYNDQDLKDQVIARYQDIVNNYPKSYYSYLALLWLLDNDQPVSEYQRGLVNYYRGQYSLANDAFHRYVKAEPGNDGSSWYFIGVCQMNIADYEGAVASFSKLVGEYPTNRYYVSAWDELAYVQWFYLDKYKPAAETLMNYVSLHPDQADSAAFLYEAGRILERGNYLSDASKVWARLIDEYPLYENSKRALFLAAISAYRTFDYETALAHLNRLLLVSGIPEDQAQANFWIAKIYQVRKDDYNMHKYLERAAEQSKTGYYSLRAAELSEGKEYLSQASGYDFNIDLESERPIADQWMMLTFGLEYGALNDPQAYQSDHDYLRGCEYYALGEYQQAVIYFELVRDKLAENPGASYVFLAEMVEKKIYSTAALTSRQILTAAGLYEDDRTLDVPNYFNHIRFGPWYSSTVESAAAEYALSPAILYGLMKQESMFNPWVSSGAGAIGLMQIMPATGAEIAKTLHWPPNYTESDLLRVQVAINFSASYLKRVKSYFDQSNAAMIASYNGGSGNTQKWLNASGSDPDLLYEVIRYQETRDYMHNIYQNAKIYDWLYAK